VSAEEAAIVAAGTVGADGVSASTASPAAGTLAGTKGKVGVAWAAIDRSLAYAGDWLNPILVKETRQALKSFQFTLTFVLLLIACWIVTVGGVAIIGPRIFYAAEGGNLLMWYYAILAFPLAVVVPYAAFRSLAAEREDNTYDLLSITTLRSRQIISGKLGSAMVQMGVYFSAITPCIAFTYLLRGIDLPTIAVLLAYLFFWSLGLSMLGILFATLTRRRFTHVFVSVALVGGLLYLFIAMTALSMPMVQSSYSYLYTGPFWIGVGAFGTAYVTFFALAYFAAAGMISFPSENRSTPLRICMLVQVACYVGWISAFWIHDNYGPEGIVYTSMMAGFYWYVMGALLTAERPGMSQRVKRRLPHSFLGRVFFSWLNPGPASGYMFAIANITALVLIYLYGVSIAASAPRASTRPWPTIDEAWYSLVIGWGYLVAYLGIGLLVIRALRRIAVVTMLASVLIHFLLLLAGFGIPYAIKSMSVELRNVDYTFLQVTDPFLSISHVANDGISSDNNTLLVIIPGVAICVLLANMPAVIRELRVVREAAPKRVLEDEAALHPEPAPQPTNPWDEPT
jgi:hypothetical protein